MGKRQFVIYLFLLLLIFPIITDACYKDSKVFISDCSINESSIIFEIEIKDVQIFDIRDVRIDYKNIPKTIKFLEDDGEVNYNKKESGIIIYLDLTDKILYTNEKADLTIKVSGGFICCDIVFEDPSIKMETFYAFPNMAYKNIKINISNQSYGLNI